MLGAWDLESIREQGDRSYSLRLLAALQDPSLEADDAHHVVRTLIELDDPRCLLTLRVIAEDTAADAGVRERALEVLGQSLAHPVGDDLREWWKSGDPALMGAALPLMDRSEADILVTVLDDPSSPWKVEGLCAIAFGFQEPEWQERKVRFLNDRDPQVRAAAARCVFWDEPLIAVIPLLALLEDDNHNDHDDHDDHDDQNDRDEVVAAAAATLAYYPSRQVAMKLSAIGYPQLLRESQSPDPSDGVLDSYRAVLEEAPLVAGRMVEWMGPVAHLPGMALEVAAFHAKADGFSSVELEAASRLERSDAKQPWDNSLLDRVHDPNHQLQPLLSDLRLLDAESIPAVLRMRVASTMCRHADANLRDRGAVLASQLGLVEPILELFDDPCTTVRKTAVYVAHDLPMNVRIAERVLHMLENNEVASTRGREALRTWVRHVAPEHARRRLIRFARDDQRESIVVGAIEELVTMEDSAEALYRLTDLLRRPPMVTWAVHVTLLDAYARLSIDPGSIDHLRNVDNVWLATAVAKLDVALGA